MNKRDGFRTGGGGSSGVATSLPAVLSTTPTVPAMVVQEYQALPNQGAATTVISLAAGNSGTICKLKLILGPGLPLSSSSVISLDGRLQISYDGGATFPFDIDLGTLCGSHWSFTTVARNGSWQAACQHFSTNYRNNGQVDLELNFPIPFSNGILVQLLNSVSGTMAANSWLWSETTYIPGYVTSTMRLRSTGALYAPPASGVDNMSGSTAGWSLTSSNLPLNNLNHGGAVALAGTATANCQLASITGTGVAVGFAYVGHQTGATASWIERNFGWYLDGATQPVVGGTTGGGSGPPAGTGIGSPTYMTSGTEDTFDSSFSSDNIDPSGLSKTTALVTNGLQFPRNTTYTAFLDVYQSCGGYPFTSSCALWLLSEVRVTSAHNFSWVLLYYQ